MNWKSDLKLSDLDGTTRLEVTCRKCGQAHYQTTATLMQQEELAQAYLDTVEKALRCSKRTCKGHVRIALAHQNKVEGFVGGMA